jgi:hypothetical protein
LTAVLSLTMRMKARRVARSIARNGAGRAFGGTTASQVG